MPGKWFHWVGGGDGGRLTDPLAAGDRPARILPDACGGCGKPLRAGGRYCPACGKAAFPVSASEEVEMPAGRTVRLAEGMLLARYDPRSLDARWREQPGGDKTDGDPRPALIVTGVGGGKEKLVALRPLIAFRHALWWGPGFELLPLEVEAESLRLLVRRTQ